MYFHFAVPVKRSSPPRLSYAIRAKMLTGCLFAGLILAGCHGKPSSTDSGSTLDPGTQARIYMKQNHFDEAEASFQKAIQLNGDEISNYIGLTQLYILQKNYKSAEEQAQNGLKIQADNAELKLLLADVYEQEGNQKDAIQQLKELTAKDPKNVKAWYKLAGLGASGTDQSWKKPYLTKVLGLVPSNIAVRLQLAALQASANQTDSARSYLESVKKIAPDFSSAADAPYQKAISALQGGKPADALPFIKDFQRLMQTTPAYATALAEVQTQELMAGSPGFIVNDDDLANTPPPNLLSHISFADASKRLSIPTITHTSVTGASLAVTGPDGVGNLFLYTTFTNSGADKPESHLYISKVGGFSDASVSGGIAHEGQDLDAQFVDYNNDGYEDLAVLTTAGLYLYKNEGDGTFTAVKENTGLTKVSGQKMLFVDLDQDGDLDLYVAQKGKNKFYRNNGDGTFTENPDNMGLGGASPSTTAMDFADWDSDGDIDVATLNEAGGVQLFNNNRHSNFKEIGDSLGLHNAALKGSATVFGDYNNDGLQDLLIGGDKCTLLKNTGHKYVVDPAGEAINKATKGMKVNDIAFVDFDNDGHQDILVAGSSGLMLFHNDTTKGFSNVSNLLPKGIKGAFKIVISDFDTDGDRDIFLIGPGGLQLLRNDGGNLNHYLKVQLMGLSYGNGKNNKLGIGGLVELKSGNLYQSVTVKGPLVEFGVGANKKFDAVRIIWPNGRPQVIDDPMKQYRMLEADMLKGSCPYLFTWNGQKYEFVKDMLWRSALGMPLYVKGMDTTYSFSDASKEYLLIPGEKLKPQNGVYKLKITEELWEAVYFDKAALVAVDHPESVDVFADERFVPPPFPGKHVYQVGTKNLPVSAVDDRGNNLLPAISKYDYQYASNFTLGQYQGLAKDHDLILDLGSKANVDSLTLFLRGWIFPGDASINTALTQNSKWKMQMPSLQVINKKGEWETVIPNMGFPMGRDKMVVADLSHKFMTKNDRRVRIRTNMQIYWDHIFFSTGQSNASVKMNDIPMTAATLNYRGYSETYRKGGPYGPEWLDYYKVTTGEKWRDLTGNYTRYGDVLPLLQNGDDQYIICNSGDQISIDFDGSKLPALPKGWKRDFLIYSEGWVKDGDLNTATGQTVAPLPFHAMPTYPYKSGINYPTDKAHQQYQKEYNTRKVTGEEFRSALRVQK